MTTLVTGSGLIGCQVARTLLEHGERPVLYDVMPNIACINDIMDINKVKIVKGNILNPTDLIHTIKTHSVDRIVHTVALMTMVARENPYEVTKINIEGTLNVLEAARIMDIRRVVFTSTSWVYYGALPSLDGPIVENFPLHFIGDRPPHAYATSKVSCEYLCFNYLDLYGLDFITVRFAAAFGPWRGHVTSLGAVLFNKVVDELLKTGSVVIDESYYPWFGRMEFTYSKDAGRGATLACFAEKPKSRVYNISMGRLYSLSDVIDILERSIPKAKIKIKYSPEASIFVQKHPMDLSRAQEEIGYMPQFLMEEALMDYINFVKVKLL